MLRGELHNGGSAGRCEACGEIFPCPTALAILAAVKKDVEQLTPAQRTTLARELEFLADHADSVDAELTAAAAAISKDVAEAHRRAAAGTARYLAERLRQFSKEAAATS